MLLLFRNGTRTNLAIRWLTAILVATSCMMQLYHAFAIGNDAMPQTDRETSIYFGRADTGNATGFGACLLFKDDLDLLPEWIAYNFVMLPLEHVVLGIDYGNSQNPRAVLDRYNDTILRYTIWDIPPSALQVSGSNNFTKEESHHDLILRQKEFISNCSLHLKSMGFSWIALVDTDEFVSPNYVNDDESILRDRLGPVSDAGGVELRKGLTREGFSTVLDHLEEWKEKELLRQTACLTLPRLLVGALENASCAENNLPASEVVGNLSTVRYLQHAPKGDFRHSKFGKVFIDVSKFPRSALASRAIRSIHRPNKDLCAPPVPHFLSAPFVLQHYIGSWERYSSRVDGRRNRAEWDQRAYVDAGLNCRMREWLSVFAKIPGWEARL